MCIYKYIFLILSGREPYEFGSMFPVPIPKMHSGGFSPLFPSGPRGKNPRPQNAFEAIPSGIPTLG